MPKKYIPSEKEKYMNTKQKTYFKTKLTELFMETLEDNTSDPENNKFEIVGSYRRGKTESTFKCSNYE